MYHYFVQLVRVGPIVEQERHHFHTTPRDRAFKNSIADLQNPHVCTYAYMERMNICMYVSLYSWYEASVKYVHSECNT